MELASAQFEKWWKLKSDYGRIEMKYWHHGHLQKCG